MSKYDLSILIPARNEEFVSNTVADILKNKRGKTEVIIGLDGVWAEPGIPDHPDVRIVYVSKSLGQRGMTNQLARLSTATYLAKCDAHVAFSEGFDVDLLDKIKGHDDWTIIPTLRNLHAFDWKCNKCGSRWFQGGKPRFCKKQAGKDNRSPVVPNLDCDNTTDFERILVWKPNPLRPSSTSFRFDRTLHFQYFNEFKKRPEGQGDVTESMSIQGSFFLLTRKKYWELNICDEAHGSWGQQGVEVACKTWLSGGQVMVSHDSWYAHLFRTQEDFGFPYENPASEQEKARIYSRDLWFNDKWDKAIHPLQWLIDRFAPVPDWHTGLTKGVIYYTDNQVPVKLAKTVQRQIKASGLPIVSSSLKPMDNMGKNVHLDMKRGSMTMFKQILAALEASTTDIIFFCEHDVLYHQSHFEFIPELNTKFYYNLNWWKVWPDGLVARWDAKQVSGLVCYRELALEYYRRRIAEMETNGFNRSYEPGGRDTSQYETWNSPFPNIDIRLSNNLTKSHRSPEDAKDKSTVQNWQETTIDKIEGWNNLSSII